MTIFFNCLSITILYHIISVSLIHLFSFLTRSTQIITINKKSKVKVRFSIRPLLNSILISDIFGGSQFNLVTKMGVFVLVDGRHTTPAAVAKIKGTLKGKQTTRCGDLLMRQIQRCLQGTMYNQRQTNWEIIHRRSISFKLMATCFLSIKQKNG